MIPAQNQMASILGHGRGRSRGSRSQVFNSQRLPRMGWRESRTVFSLSRFLSIHTWPIGSMYAIYGNMDPINIPPMLAYIPAPWILWVMIHDVYMWTCSINFTCNFKTSVPWKFTRFNSTRQIRTSTRSSLWGPALKAGPCYLARAHWHWTWVRHLDRTAGGLGMSCEKLYI